LRHYIRVRNVAEIEAKLNDLIRTLRRTPTGGYRLTLLGMITAIEWVLGLTPDGDELDEG